MQANHLFASNCAFIKLGRLKMVEHINHFALKTRLYIKATKATGGFSIINILSELFSGPSALKYPE